jgi:hypothetical protein
MRTAWIAMALAAATMACGGSDRQRDEQAAVSLQGRPTSTATLTLTGCVQAGSLETKFVLQNVQSGAPDQQRNTTDRTSDSATATVTEGSMVQLRAADEAELERYVGHHVRITGTLVDTGANTIGTRGTKGEQLPSGDKSMASQQDEHYSTRQKQEAGRIGRNWNANGTAPIVRVDHIQPTGQPCSSGS